jgi:large subunit ribosomal protein L10
LEKQKKIQMALQLSESCQKSAGFFILGYQGLKVEESNDLRKKLRSVGARARVVKNYVAQKALDPLSIDVNQYLKGQTLFVFVNEDLAASAKVLRDFTKEHTNLSLKGGYSEGQVLSKQDVFVYADLPSRQELLASLLRVIQGPATHLVRVCQGVPGALVRVIQAIADQKAS